MSYTLRPDDEQEREDRAAAHVTEPISLKRIGIAVGIGSMIIISLAGLPSWSRHRRPLPATDGLCHSASPLIEYTCRRELDQAFADLIAPVDPATHQRPAYPTTDQLFARLLPIGHWRRAVLFAFDASIAELKAAGLADERQRLDLNYGHPDGLENPVAMLAHWQLVLIDDLGCVVGRTMLEVPTLEVERCGDGDEAAFATYPVLEKRFPDWPRVAVFNRPLPEAQSDG